MWDPRIYISIKFSSDDDNDAATRGPHCNTTPIVEGREGWKEVGREGVREEREEEEGNPGHSP